MRVGLFLLPLIGPIELIRKLAEGAEGRQFDSLWVPEPHLLVFDEVRSTFPYTPDGKMPEEYGTEGEHEGLLTLGYLAGCTERIRLGIGVCIVPQRNPVYIAKDVTTLDHLSNGRFDLGVGIGWLAEEFEAVGTPFANRADRCRDHVEVMRRLWTEAPAQYEGRYFSLPKSRQDPRPVQQPHPPIHFGGNSRAALRRVADLGQGWLPWDLRPAQVKQDLAVLTNLLEDRGRSRGEIEVSAAIVLEGAPDLSGYEEAGVDQLLVVVDPVTSESDIDPLLDRLTTSVLQTCHEL
jgi:probable F420-dependent oxidoreductase